VAQVDRSGEKRKFERVHDKMNKNHHYVKTTLPGNKWQQTDYYQDQNKQVYTDNEGHKRTVHLTACCAKPLSKTNEKGQSEYYEYDASNNLKRTTYSDGSIFEYEYGGRFNQPTRITESSGRITTIVYDSRGNITSSKNNKGQNIDITYDRRGKPTRMTDNKTNTIEFIYNFYGKPTKIIKPGLGETAFTYDKFGNQLTAIGKAYPGSKIPKEQINQQIQNSLISIIGNIEPRSTAPAV
jgi:YD repeat-containing protein